MSTHPLASTISAAFEDRSLLSNESTRNAVLSVIDGLDRGELRVAEKLDGEWVTHAWVKQAVLLYFGLRQLETYEVGPLEFHDKIPVKKHFADAKVRVVPPAVARYGSFLEPGVIMMPSYVNIGARVGSVRWSTRGQLSVRCARIGKGVPLREGSGLAGCLGPPGVRDHRGRRVRRLTSRHRQGCRRGPRAVIGAGHGAHRSTVVTM
ncbi:MAG: hypothetical protein U0165_19715 [Polyangiaceae bacterium]